MHILTISIARFTAEFAAVQGLLTASSIHRRSAAIDALTADLFTAINTEFDPNSLVSFSPDMAEGVLDAAVDIAQELATKALSIRGPGRTGRWTAADIMLIRIWLGAVCEARMREIFPGYSLGDEDLFADAA